MTPEFRVWDKLTQKYWNIENWHFEDEYLDLIEPGVSICDPRIERIWRKQGDVEIMQYTGLKDVNGEDIYEGDIVHGYDQEPDRDDGYIGSSVIDVVNFKYGAFWIGNSWNKIMVMTPPIVEVIGNVYENPELLEGISNND
ncbi:YopX family protein [Limosilactobacillus fermentum]|uniref:YopX family protein n=1 Tax=Limosilactobacillus fermentum TaxID=1613 RepID=UPI003DA41307